MINPGPLWRNQDNKPAGRDPRDQSGHNRRRSRLVGLAVAAHRAFALPLWAF